MEPLLKLTGITKEFSSVRVLDSVNFDLHAGEVHALLGENGAGKSTLIKIIAGVYEKTEGSVLLEGKPVHIRNTKEALELGINTIYQELSLIPGMDIARNMFLGKEIKATALGGLSKQIYIDTVQMLKKVGLEHIPPTTKVADLKIAYRQLIEISKAISTTQCKVIIMDEPTSSLTDDETEKLFSLIEELKKQEIGIIYISHKLEEVTRIADRVTVLRDGRKVGTLKKEEIHEKAILKMMVGRDIAPVEKEARDIGETVLSVEGLRLGAAVNNVSFSIRKGEILGFFGLVGAGRTELMRLIFAAEKPEAGRIYVNGKPVRLKRPGDAVQMGIGLLPEDRKEQAILSKMSNLSNITIASLSKFKKLIYINKSQQRKKCKEVTADLKIKYANLEQQIKFLSGGNQQKCILARWLISGSNILILDEPTRGIDVGAKQDVYTIIRELAKNGLAILLVSSEMPEILNLSDRVIVMHEGEITAELQGSDIAEDIIIRHAFGEKQLKAAGGSNE